MQIWITPGFAKQRILFNWKTSLEELLRISLRKPRSISFKNWKDNGHLQFQVHVHYRINLRALPKHADHSKYRHVRARIWQTLWFFRSHVLHARTMTVVDDDDDDDNNDRQFLINVWLANMCFDPRRYSCCFECGTLLCRRLKSQVCTVETAAAKTKFYSKRLNKLKFKQKSHKFRNQFVCYKWRRKCANAN
jgi:hypothetical protein